jgi:hypothetical protein
MEGHREDLQAGEHQGRHQEETAGDLKEVIRKSKDMLFVNTHHQGIHLEDPFQEEAFHQEERAERHQEAWESPDQEGMGVALSHH